jgi:hypothetical protein
MDALVAGVDAGWGRDRLAAEADRLVRDLLVDMEAEEQDSLAEELLRDDVVAIDQSTD